MGMLCGMIAAAWCIVQVSGLMSDTHIYLIMTVVVDSALQNDGKGVRGQGMCNAECSCVVITRLSRVELCARVRE